MIVDETVFTIVFAVFIVLGTLAVWSVLAALSKIIQYLDIMLRHIRQIKSDVDGMRNR
jgi:hypothetical protein